ncbi:MAG: hypothetical protein Q6365_017885 [Candidatus Sigynarchaeota archaeon]
MNAIPDDKQRTVVTWFFKYVAWPSLRHLIADLFPPGEIAGIRESLEKVFVDSTRQEINEPDGRRNRFIESINGNTRISTAPEWIKKLLIGILDEFTNIVAHYFQSATPENEDLIEYVENAMILYLFDAIFWKFPRDQLIMHGNLSVNSLAEVKEKLLEQLRRYLDGDITLKEAKRAAASFLESIELDNDLSHEIISSYIANFYEIINGLDMSRLHAFIEDFTRSRGEFLEMTHEHVADETSKEIVLRWFEQDVVSLSMKSIAELYPELTKEAIDDWKTAITRDLELVLQNLLSFDDFEKRLIVRLRLPKLEFDIEKPVDENNFEDHYMHIEDRGGALETIMASAELIYKEALKDATLKDLATRIASRKESLDNLYM